MWSSWLSRYDKNGSSSHFSIKKKRRRSTSVLSDCWSLGFFDGLDRATSDGIIDSSFALRGDFTGDNLAVIIEGEDVSSDASAGTTSDAEIFVHSNFFHLNNPPKGILILYLLWLLFATKELGKITNSSLLKNRFENFFGYCWQELIFEVR